MTTRIIAVIFLALSISVPAFGDKVVFFDDFNDNAGNWVVENASEYNLAVSHGYYTIINRRNGQAQMSYIKPLFLDISKDFAIEASIRVVEGDLRGFGVIFGIQPNRDHFRFEIAENGHFSIVETKGMEIIPHCDWTPSQAIAQGSNFNVLRIYKKNNTIAYYIGDTPVAVSENIVLSGDNLGFIAEGRMHIQVDYIRVTQGAPSWVTVNAASRAKPIGVDIHNVYVSPPEIRRGGNFVINMEYTVNDPANAGKTLDIEAAYTISRGGKELFSEKAEMRVPEGQKYFSKKSGLTASNDPGTYELKTRISYNGKISEKSIALDVR